VNGSVSIRRTLSLAGITIIDTGGAQSRRLYPIADHLGSPIAIADGAGHLIQGLAYADFGKRYSAGWASPLTTAQALGINTGLSDRGYTGQESLDAIGLDDYNARLYDPTLGRFLSVDPLIAHPGSTQSINPYSYVENNPLNKTDPTGEVIDNCYTTFCERHNLGSFGPIIFYGTVGMGTHIKRPNKSRRRARSKLLDQLLKKKNQEGQGVTPSNTKTNTNTHNYNGKQPDTVGVGAIKGYPEKGKDSWRASNDKLFEDAAKAFDKAHTLSPGDSLYLTGKQIKAWAMVESGGSKKAFTTDPLQANANPKDFRPPKGKITGLRKNEKMTPQKSVNAALKWLWHKATIHDTSGRITGYRSLHDAFRRYNGKSAKFPDPEETHAEWYADKVISLGGG